MSITFIKESKMADVTISQAEYDELKSQIAQLKERDRLLSALEASGVDNWDGIDYAYEMLEEGIF